MLRPPVTAFCPSTTRILSWLEAMVEYCGSPPTSWSREPGNPLTLIGLAGRAGTGKDTVAAHLAERYNVLLYALANPIRGALAGAFGLGDELVDRSLKELPVPWLGQSPRRLMQSLGDWGRELCGADVWLRVAERVGAEAEHAPESDYGPAKLYAMTHNQPATCATPTRPSGCGSAAAPSCTCAARTRRRWPRTAARPACASSPAT